MMENPRTPSSTGRVTSFAPWYVALLLNFCYLANIGRMTSQQAYRAQTHIVSDADVQRLIDQATRIIDPMAEDSWAQYCLILMPTYRTRIEREAEVARRAEQARIEAEERAAEEERRIAKEKHVAAEKLKRKKQQESQQRDRERSRTTRNTETAPLSPSSSRAVVQRKSASSIGDSNSGSDVVRSRRPQRGSQKTGSGKGKGKAPKEGAEEYQEPPLLPKHAKLVSCT